MKVKLRDNNLTSYQPLANKGSRRPYFLQRFLFAHNQVVPDSKGALRTFSPSHNDLNMNGRSFLTHFLGPQWRARRVSPVEAPGFWETRTADYPNKDSQILRGSLPQMSIRHSVYRNPYETQMIVSGRGCLTVTGSL